MRPSVLVVDDDATFRARLARAFAQRGYEVREAAGAEEALARASEDSPVVRELHRIDPATRIVVLTGYGSIATALDALRLGATHYLQKPADVDEIEAGFRRGAPTEDPAPSELAVPSLARVEWEHIDRVLSDCGGNVSQAARKLGLHRRSLQRKLGKRPVPR
jgi:two-component system response regulator RegA